MGGLVLDIGTREWKSDDIIVADAPVVAETVVERRPPTVEIKIEQTPTAPVMAEDSSQASVAHGGDQSRAKAYDTTGST